MLTIRKLERADVEELSILLLSEDEKNLRYFNPFNFDVLTLELLVSGAVKDFYFVLELNGRLIGFYMLRGLDDGYPLPAYGVFVKSEFAGNGLGRFTLEHAKIVCRLLGIDELCLTVYRGNERALGLYKSFGFNEVTEKSTEKSFFLIKNLTK